MPAPSRPRTASVRRAWVAPVLGTLAATALLVGLLDPSAASTAAGPPPEQAEVDEDILVAQGENLFMLGCVSCHGPDGQGQRAPDGSARGPSLVEAGEAGAFYQLTTGRMPLANPRDVPRRKEPAYSDEEIAALVAFVASLGDGPALPEVDVDAGDVAEGGVLFRESCQACHSATGAGGALSYGRAAPALGSATPEQVGAAVRSGPGQMPRFGPEILDDQQVDDITSYVVYLEDPEDPGGLALGRLGPIPEGFLIWVGGLGLLLVVAYWLGTRRSTQPVAPATPIAADAPVPRPDPEPDPLPEPALATPEEDGEP